MVQATVALRVDVCTRRGLDEGVPRLLERLRRIGVSASFFVTMGPDRSGAALGRLVRPGFLLKMWRTNPLRLYGLRTLLSGTLLRPRLVGAAAPALLREIAGEGHEVAPHGWDHVGWQDRIAGLGADAMRADLEKAARAFEAGLGAAARASAAPGWRTTTAALDVQQALGLRYASDTRGAAPFRPLLGDGRPGTLELPTTLPTLDELLGRARDPVRALLDALGPGLHVLTAHAEVEGGPHAGVLEGFLTGARRQGVRLVRLIDAADAVLAAGEVPVAALGRGRVPGRAGWVATRSPAPAACRVDGHEVARTPGAADRPALGGQRGGAAGAAGDARARAHRGPERGQ